MTGSSKILTVIIVIMKFVAKTSLIFILFFFIHASSSGILQRYLATYIYIYTHASKDTVRTSYL